MIDPKEREPSSFRDKDGYIFYKKGEVFRKLENQEAIISMEKLLKSSLYTTFKDVMVESCISKDIMQHEKIEVITYPYEWSFTMLCDAALVQLNIVEQGLKENFILKDGSAFNCVYSKGKMVFIDLLSIENLKGHKIWEGYHQFCEHFLYPLMIKAYKNINFQLFWRGTGNGISTQDFFKFLSYGDYFRKGVFIHGVLKNKLGNLGDASPKVSSQAMHTNNIQHIEKLIKNLKNLILKFQGAYVSSIWTDYATNNTYKDGKYEQKKEFIEGYVKSLDKHSTLVDLGCNTGDFSNIASQYVRLIKAVDFDADCIDRIYLKIQEGKFNKNIVPIVADLMNPSPSLGWDLKERKDLLSRLQSGSFLALALIHHICIAQNVPLSYFVEFLRKIAPEGIVEWVGMDDPMVKTLLKNRKNIFEDYTWENFKQEIEKLFSIEKTFEFENSDRKLCIVKAK